MANVSNIKVKSGNLLVASGSSVELSGSQVRTNGDLIVQQPSNPVVQLKGSGSSTYVEIYNTTSSIEDSAYIGEFKVKALASGSSVGSRSSIRTQYTGSDGEAYINFLAGNANSVNMSSVAIFGNSTGIQLKNDVTVNGTVSSSGNIATAGDLAVNGGDITSTAAILNINAGGTLNVQDNLTVQGTVSSSGGATVGGDLVVGGKVTANEFHVTIVTSSVLYQSGSTKFGDSLDDTHVFTGSVNITGSQHNIVGNLFVTGGFTATQNISGTFVGNGSGLTNLPFPSISVLEQLTVTGSYAVLNADHVIFADASSAALTLTLPAPTVGGKEYIIKKVDINTSNAVTLSASAGTIDGENPVDIFGAFQSVTLIANGTDKWFIV